MSRLCVSQGAVSLNVMSCAIWCHLYNLKNVKSIHGGVLILVKLQASATLLKLTLLDGCFLCFLNCANGTKSRNASQISVLTANEASKILKSEEN